MHYTDREWKLHAKCLQTHCMPETYTGENLKEALISTVSHWRLDPDKQQILVPILNLACQL